MPRFIHAVNQLIEWFHSRRRILPWRDNPSIYRVWVSEIMLQQTQVKTVIPYFTRFLEKFPSVESLASAPLESVLQSWSGLGYYSRAVNLHRTARIIVEKGAFPVNRQEWLALPGIGEYTAGAVLSIALNQPEPILDANMKRVFARLRRLNSPSKDEYWKLSAQFVQEAHQNNLKPSELNQALMELGALVCLPKKPLCDECPLNQNCKAKNNNDMEKFPVRIKKTWLTVNEMVYAFIDKKENVLLFKNPDAKWRKGLWDFPDKMPDFIRFIEKGPDDKIGSRYTVTNHKVIRRIIIYRNVVIPARLPDSYQTVSLNNPDWLNLAAGSPVKRTLKQLSGLL
jgi:A/G-specific adenine glycosylase